MKEAMFYEKLEKGEVRCKLCPHRCKLQDNKSGICGVRQNQDGVLYSLVYGKLIAMHVDPIEKKPLYHLYPNSKSFSIATVGCNFHCDFCQNHDISQVSKVKDIQSLGENVSPQEVVFMAAKYDCRTIAYTYTEPTIFFEYAYDCARLAHDKEILNIFVTNGYISKEPLDFISPYLDAANVDLKSFNENFYRKWVGAKLSPVLDSLGQMKKLGIWIEVTTLIVPTLNDSDNELKEIARFIKNDLGVETPWHISRFYPQHKVTHLPPTSVETLQRAREIGLSEGLRYVYTGNVPGEQGEHTFCYNCGKSVIRRYGYQILEYNIKESKCTHCGVKIDGIGL